MTDVETFARRIWEHVEHIKFFLRRIFFGLVGAVFDPLLLPLLLAFLVLAAVNS
jgi:hypothetical protein